MRIDKLTTAFQQALAESQSLAVARDNPYIEPAHLLAAMLQQPDGPKALLDRAGANTAALRTAMDTAIGGLPDRALDPLAEAFPGLAVFLVGIQYPLDDVGHFGPAWRVIRQVGRDQFVKGRF